MFSSRIDWREWTCSKEHQWLLNCWDIHLVGCWSNRREDSFSIVRKDRGGRRKNFFQFSQRVEKRWLPIDIHVDGIPLFLFVDQSLISNWEASGRFVFPTEFTLILSFTSLLFHRVDCSTGRKKFETDDGERGKEREKCLSRWKCSFCLLDRTEWRSSSWRLFHCSSNESFDLMMTNVFQSSSNWFVDWPVIEMEGRRIDLRRLTKDSNRRSTSDLLDSTRGHLLPRDVLSDWRGSNPLHRRNFTFLFHFHSTFIPQCFSSICNLIESVLGPFSRSIVHLVHQNDQMFDICHLKANVMFPSLSSTRKRTRMGKLASLVIPMTFGTSSWRPNASTMIKCFFSVSNHPRPTSTV